MIGSQHLAGHTSRKSEVLHETWGVIVLAQLREVPRTRSLDNYTHDKMIDTIKVVVQWHLDDDTNLLNQNHTGWWFQPL